MSDAKKKDSNQSNNTVLFCASDVSYTSNNPDFFEMAQIKNKNIWHNQRYYVVSCKLFWKSAPELELELKKLTLCNRAVFLTILSSSPQCIVTQLHDCSCWGPSEMGRQGQCLLKWGFTQTLLGNRDATLKLISELTFIQFC